MHRVPLLEDADLTLTESSAILKYLAEKVDAPVCPKDDLQKRAQINERLDWFNTGFYMDYGYNLVYPQILPHVRREPEAARAARWRGVRTRVRTGSSCLTTIGSAHNTT